MIYYRAVIRCTLKTRFFLFDSAGVGVTKEVPKRFRYNVDSLQGELLKINFLYSRIYFESLCVKRIWKSSINDSNKKNTKALFDHCSEFIVVTVLFILEFISSVNIVYLANTIFCKLPNSFSFFLQSLFQFVWVHFWDTRVVYVPTVYTVKWVRPQESVI